MCTVTRRRPTHTADYPTPPHIVDAGIAALHAGHTTYCNPSGTAEIKAAVARKMSRRREVVI